MPILITYGFVFGLSCAAFNGFGTYVTKYCSAMNRTVVEQMRVIVIWLFFMLKPGLAHETFSFTKLLGFIFIVTGVMFFNKVLVVDGCSIRYTGNDEPEKSPRDYRKDGTDEELTGLKEDCDEVRNVLLPKLELDDNPKTEESTNSTNNRAKLNKKIPKRNPKPASRDNNLREAI